MVKASAVFFDFDGVLCTDRFYANLAQDYPKAPQFITEYIFQGSQKYAERWMKGEFSYHEINKLISNSTGIPFDRLTELFRDSVRQMRLNPALMQFAISLKQKGIKIALVTGNMDIFNEITIPEKRLAEVFPVIINSFDYKMEKNGKLFDIALNKLGLTSYQGVCLIDDSPKMCAIFKSKGGYAFQYSGQNEFELWLGQSHLF